MSLSVHFHLIKIVLEHTVRMRWKGLLAVDLQSLDLSLNGSVRCERWPLHNN